MVERELFAADVECIESVGAVGAVFEEVFFRFGKFFASFVFAEADDEPTERVIQGKSW